RRRRGVAGMTCSRTVRKTRTRRAFGLLPGSAAPERISADEVSEAHSVCARTAPGLPAQPSAAVPARAPDAEETDGAPAGGDVRARPLVPPSTASVSYVRAVSARLRNGFPCLRPARLPAPVHRADQSGRGAAQGRGQAAVLEIDARGAASARSAHR